MERVIYCPSAELLDDAEKEAKNTLLPIVVGESDRLKDLQFDRSVVSVVQIPKHRFLDVSSTSVKLGTHQYVYVIDEFCDDLSTSYSVLVNSEKVFPMYWEKHSAKWAIPCNVAGKFSVNVLVNGVSVLEQQYDVC